MPLLHGEYSAFYRVYIPAGAGSLPSTVWLKMMCFPFGMTKTHTIWTIFCQKDIANNQQPVEEIQPAKGYMFFLMVLYTHRIRVCHLPTFGQFL